ncbi:MAG: hypothetical protein VKL39_01410 [Leptolyngbyaceae bacterium]|nr:hypothetical protein [Leptolyngbyaceae bacterium]
MTHTETITDTISWVQVAIAFGGSVILTIVVFGVLVWRDYRRDRKGE